MTIQQTVDDLALGQFIRKAIETGRLYAITISDTGYTCCIYQDIRLDNQQEMITGENPLEALTKLNKALGEKKDGG